MAAEDHDDDDNDDGADDTRVGRIEFSHPSGTQRDRPYLIVLAGTNVGEMYRIVDGESVIGRGQDATIRLSDDGISRRQARIVHLAGEVVLEDLKSANGTHVNGSEVTRTVLKDGDKIRFGSTTILKFTYHDDLDESFQKQMYDAALRDGLTRAFNKKYFLDRLETEHAYAKRHKAPMSLLMFDVDHFKRVNDTHGHLAGDHVLSKIAKIAMTAVRQEDVFARYGGEEFAVLCRGVTLSSGAVLAERLRSMVASGRFEHQGAFLPITISVGVASFPETNAANGAELIAAADAALYEAKRSGRNRVVKKS
jgi:diguanylate cyclase (GGDEF)-like protein